MVNLAGVVADGGAGRFGTRVSGGGVVSGGQVAAGHRATVRGTAGTRGGGVHTCSCRWGEEEATAVGGLGREPRGGGTEGVAPFFGDGSWVGFRVGGRPAAVSSVVTAVVVVAVGRGREEGFGVGGVTVVG